MSVAHKNDKSFLFDTIIKKYLESKIACCCTHFGKLQGALHVFYLQTLLHHRMMKEYVRPNEKHTAGPETSSLI